MEDFESRPRHYAEHRNRKDKFPIVLFLILSLIIVIIVVWGGIKLFTKSDNDTKESIEPSTIIQNDPHLGEVVIPSVENIEINKYDNNNFAKDENGFMVYTENGVVTSSIGLDLSELQGNVDFYALKEQNIEFVILRIGGRGYGQAGTLYADSRFDEYYQGAKNAGLKVGAYFFSQATSKEEAKAEAEYALSLLNGRALDFPLAYDWEIMEGVSDARTNGMDKNVITDCAVAFCETVKSAGYKPLIYINTSLIYQTYDVEKIKDYDLWHAEYTDTPSLYYDFTIWQYSNQGQVDGINTNVDLNICLKK